MERRPPASGPSRLARTTSATAIYRALHTEIAALHLVPGTALSETALGELYGVSRTPVREALIRLGEDRLVDVVPQLGSFVARIDRALVREAVFIRQALEGATIAGAARSATAEDVARLDDILAHQRFFADRKDFDRFMESDEAFHETIAAIAGYPGIWTHLRPVKVHIDRARRLTMPVLERMEPVIVEHHVIRDAIAAHDVAGASTAMTRHLNAVIPDLAELGDKFPDYFYGSPETPAGTGAASKKTSKRR